MKDLTTYLNESLLDAIVKIFVGKIKMLQKKFNISENSINDLSTSLSEIQDELNNELNKLSNGKVKDSADWWKQLLKVKPEVAKGAVPEKINNQLFTNILNVSGVYSKALESWDNIEILDTEGVVGSISYVLYDGKLLGYLCFNDTARKEAKEGIDTLKQMGIEKTVMLTGDRKEAAEKICNEIGIDSLEAQLLP
jgi:high-affinity K+ transport system ATPase subunit B